LTPGRFRPIDAAARHGSGQQRGCVLPESGSPVRRSPGSASIYDWLWIVTLLAIGHARAATNQVQVDVHDPAMAREKGIYYLFSSGPGITFYSSPDVIHWTCRGRVFPGDPAWAKGVASRFNGHVWAPDIIFHDGRYFLYYAVSSSGQISSAIGLTINKTLDPASPDYHWQDQGIVLQSVPGRDLWNAIDPNVVVDEHGDAWMDFGSFWSGIKLVKLDDTWKSLASPQVWYSLAKRERSIFVDDRVPGPAELEGPFIFRHGDYYYLFVSWGLCCRGNDSTYRITMGRSRDIRGPYLDKDGKGLAYGGGTLLLGGDKDWPGRGGCSVYSFDGKVYMVLHAYEAADNGLQKLKIAELHWDAAQWPVVDWQSLNEYHSVRLQPPASLEPPATRATQPAERQLSGLPAKTQRSE
jgi:arabinan endo-1,5-alpha-L-arabinosidase